jgi:uncharacterized protein YutE (UPF0331/DUF86 family)
LQEWFIKFANELQGHFQKEKPRDYKKKIEKLQKLEFKDEIVKLIIRMYMLRQNLFHTVRFLLWT